MNSITSPVVLRRGHEISRRQPCVRVCVLGPSEEQNVGLRLVDFIVHPPSRLLHSQPSPLVLSHQPPLRQFFHDVFGDNHMPVFVVIVKILLGILNFGRIVRHFYLNFNYNRFIYLHYIINNYSQLLLKMLSKLAMPQMITSSSENMLQVIQKIQFIAEYIILSKTSENSVALVEFLAAFEAIKFYYRMKIFIKQDNIYMEEYKQKV